MALTDPHLGFDFFATPEQTLRIVMVERDCPGCKTPNRWWSDARNPRCAECRRPLPLP